MAKVPSYTEKHHKRKQDLLQSHVCVLNPKYGPLAPGNNYSMTQWIQCRYCLGILSCPFHPHWLPGSHSSAISPASCLPHKPSLSRCSCRSHTAIAFWLFLVPIWTCLIEMFTVFAEMLQHPFLPRETWPSLQSPLQIDKYHPWVGWCQSVRVTDASHAHGGEPGQLKQCGRPA